MVQDGFPLGAKPLDENSELRARIIKFNTEVCHHLNAPDGCTHLEVFLRDSDSELVFLEIGARPGGAWVPQIMEENYKINTYQESLKITLGLANNKKVTPKAYYAEIYWPYESFKIKNKMDIKVQSEIKIEWPSEKINTKISQGGTIDKVAVRICLKNSNYKMLTDDFNYLKTIKPIIYDYDVST